MENTHIKIISVLAHSQMDTEARTGPTEAERQEFHLESPVLDQRHLSLLLQVR